MRINRFLLACTTLIGGLSIVTAGNLPAFAAPAAPAKEKANHPNPNMVLATVDGQKITLGDLNDTLSETLSTLPPQARNIPTDKLAPMVLNQIISQKAIEIAAKKEKLESKASVKISMHRAAQAALIKAYIQEKVEPKITDSTIKAYYDSHYANKKPEEEVHARHILVDSEAKAKDLITKLEKGADFAKLAAENSSDTATAKKQGGDLGWFKSGDMIPDFSKAAFATKPGTYTKQPIHTAYGWHIIEVLGTRKAPVPKFEDIKFSIQQKLLRQEIANVIQTTAKKVKVVHYDANGKVIPDTATPAKSH